MKISDFFKHEVCDYASYDNYRKMASVCDSFKPSARKCIYTVIKNKVTSPIKVANLKSDAARQTQYLHGDQSLEGVIVGLAQDFPGANNIPFLKREGTFGNRLVPAAAAGRYIFTCKEDYLDKIFKKEDEPLLTEQIFEGDVIEPKFYMPVLPLLAINGSIGLTTGFTQKILPHSIKDCIKYIEGKLDGKKSLPKLIPWFKGFTGDVKENKDKNDGCSWYICGKYNKISSNEIEITELPIGYTLEDYSSILNDFEDKKMIKEYKDLSDEGKFKFIVKFFRNDMGFDINDPDLLGKMKLITPITEIYTSLDENNKVVEYKDIYEIVDHYFDLRLSFYDKRKNFQVAELTQKIRELVSKYTFVKGVIDGDIVISNKKDEQIINQLKKFEKIIMVNDSYDYLLNMPIRSITKEKYDQLKEQIKTLKAQLDEMKVITSSELWKRDLEEVKKVVC